MGYYALAYVIIALLTAIFLWVLSGQTNAAPFWECLLYGALWPFIPILVIIGKHVGRGGE